VSLIADWVKADHLTLLSPHPIGCTGSACRQIADHAILFPDPRRRHARGQSALEPSSRE
jgi:hypothetical protein